MTPAVSSSLSQTPINNILSTITPDSGLVWQKENPNVLGVRQANGIKYVEVTPAVEKLIRSYDIDGLGLQINSLARSLNIRLADGLIATTQSKVPVSAPLSTPAVTPSLATAAALPTVPAGAPVSTPVKAAALPVAETKVAGAGNWLTRGLAKAANAVGDALSAIRIPTPVKVAGMGAFAYAALLLGTGPGGKAHAEEGQSRPDLTPVPALTAGAKPGVTAEKPTAGQTASTPVEVNTAKAEASSDLSVATLPTLGAVKTSANPAPTPVIKNLEEPTSGAAGAKGAEGATGTPAVITTSDITAGDIINFSYRAVGGRYDRLSAKAYKFCQETFGLDIDTLNKDRGATLKIDAKLVKVMRQVIDGKMKSQTKIAALLKSATEAGAETKVTPTPAPVVKPQVKPAPASVVVEEPIEVQKRDLKPAPKPADEPRVDLGAKAKPSNAPEAKQGTQTLGKTEVSAPIDHIDVELKEVQSGDLAKLIMRMAGCFSKNASIAPAYELANQIGITDVEFNAVLNNRTLKVEVSAGLAELIEEMNKGVVNKAKLRAAFDDLDSQKTAKQLNWKKIDQEAEDSKKRIATRTSSSGYRVSRSSGDRIDRDAVVGTFSEITVDQGDAIYHRLTVHIKGRKPETKEETIKKGFWAKARGVFTR